MSMDRELPAEVVKKDRIKKLSGVAAVVLLVLIAFFTLRAIIAPTLERDKIRTSIAELGSIEETLTASGVVVPEFEQVITSPVASTIEKVILKTGESVRTGESILELNKERLRSTHDNLKDELALQKNKKQLLELNLQQKQIDLQATYDIKELQTQFVQAQYDRVKHLHDIGGANLEELDRASLNLEIAKRELALVAKQIENQQVSFQTDLQGLDLEIRIRENKLGEIQRDLELADARSGRDGVVTWINDNIGSPVDPGDVVARVADLGSFKVEASISDIHAGKLKTGGAVKLRSGDKMLTGHIGSIRPAVQNGIVTFIVNPDDKADPSLRANLRVDVYVVTSFKSEVVRVKNGPFYDGIVEQTVFVIQGNKAVGHTVDIGVANFDWVEIQGDIAPGDEVIISDTKDYRHLDEIAITGSK